MAKSRYADATKAARRAAMSAHKVTAAASNAVADAQPSAGAATEPARDAPDRAGHRRARRCNA